MILGGLILKLREKCSVMLQNFLNLSEFVQSVVKSLADVDITKREADELTSYF